MSMQRDKGMGGPEMVSCYFKGGKKKNKKNLITGVPHTL